MLRLAVAVAVLVGSAEAAAASFSITADGTAVSFGGVSPQEGTSVVPNAGNLHVMSSGAEWTLSVRATGDLQSTQEPVRTLPAARLRVGVHGSALRVPLSTTDQALLAAQAATPGTGRSVALDYDLCATWGDAALPSGDRYSTTVVYTVTAGTVDGAYVTPSPFSPDGDGVLDQAVFHFWLGAAGTGSVRVVDGAGQTVRQVLAAGQLSAGEVTVSWDGTNDSAGAAPQGTYRFLAEDGGGALLASAEVQLERTSASGTAQVSGLVRDASGAGLEGVTVRLVRASGIVHATTTTGAAGTYAFASVGAGQYLLRAEKALYLAYESPVFDLSAGGSVSRDIVLVHNHSLIIGLTASRDRASVGDLVALEVLVKAVGTTAVDDVVAALSLGAGLRPIAGTLRGAHSDGKGLGALRLGRLEPGETRRIRLLVGIAAGHGERIASARARGLAAGERAAAGPAQVRIALTESELSGRGGVYGRVCIDVDGDRFCDDEEPPAARAVVFLEDGSHAEADDQGLFHLAPLRPGPHVLLGGHGPLQAPARAGGFPKLPRSWTGEARFDLPAGHYVSVDVPLPAPPGYVVPIPRSDDEGDVLPPPPRADRPLPPGSDRTLSDEGTMDGRGMLVGFARAPPRAVPPGGAVPPPAEPALGPRAITGGAEEGGTPPGAEELDATEPSTALVGVADATLTLGTRRLEGLEGHDVAGRLALTVQHDFGPEARLTLVADTARDGTVERLAALDAREGYRDLGDESRTAMSQQDRLYLRLDLPQLHAQVGRMSAALGGGELIVTDKIHLGGELGAGRPGGDSARVFAGFVPELELEEELPGRDSTGPYRLGAAPVVPGSEVVEIVLLAGSGEVRQRIELQRDADYVIDLERGELHLARPLPSRSPAGDRTVLRVRYQAVTDGPEAAGLIAGARAETRRRERHLGLTVLHEEHGDEALTAGAVDGGIRLGPVSVEAALGTSQTGGDEELAARSAARLRTGLEIADGTELFAFALGNGESWQPRIRSPALAIPALSPFNLLDAHGGTVLSMPVLSLALAQDPGLPFQLADEPGRVEVGAGARVEHGGITALTLGRSIWEPEHPDEARDTVEVAAAAELDDDRRVYAAHESSARSGELHGAADAPRERRSVLGSQARFGPLLGELDLQHVTRELDGGPPAASDDVVLKLLHDRVPAFQPAALAGIGWLRRDDALGTTLPVAVGFESVLGAGARGFAYGQHVEAWGEGVEERDGVFAGLQLSRPRYRLLLRYDLAITPLATDQVLSWDARVRAAAPLTLGSDGTVRLGDASPDRFVRLTGALRPRGPVTLLARAQDELRQEGQLRTRTRLAAADVGTRLGPIFTVWTKGLVRQQQITEPLESGSGVVDAVAGLAGLRVVVRPWRAWDVAVGGRYLLDPRGPGSGLTLEAGRTFAQALRVALGANLGTRAEVFAIEDQAPGLFVSVTGDHAGPAPATSSPPP